MIRHAFPLALGLFSGAFSANLQPQDFLFISTHRNPVTIESDDKSAYVLTEGGVLLYDYRRKQWVDNIAPGRGVKDIAFNPAKNQLLMLTNTGTVLEYNSAFRRVENSSSAFVKSGTGSAPPDLNGLSLGTGYFFLGDAVRDSYNRRYPITLSRTFDYDNFWLLTAGAGPFLGSLRRKDLSSVGFGLYDSSVTAISVGGQRLWFGSPNPAGALVRAEADLTGWKSYASQQDYQFPNGAVNDIVEWRGYVWAATANGVVRQDPATGAFKQYRRMLGSTDLVVNRLIVQDDRLFAGTERGIASLSSPDLAFTANEMPVSISPSIRGFATANGHDLWAATDYGLFVLRPNGWRSIKDVTRNDVPEAYAVPVTAVAYADSSLFWAREDRVYIKPRREEQHVFFSLDDAGDSVFRLIVDGNMLYAGFSSGVRVYNLKNRLWVDFHLTDGIPGTKVQSLAVAKGYLWIGTDLGVMRIRVAPYLP